MKGRTGDAGFRNKLFIAIALLGIILIGYTFFSGPSDSTEPTSVSGSLPKKPDVTQCQIAKYSKSDLKKHTACSIRNVDANDLWLAIDGYVYDVSLWIEQHPGGEAICDGAAADASRIFRKVHSDPDNIIKNILQNNYCIGKYSYE